MKSWPIIKEKLLINFQDAHIKWKLEVESITLLYNNVLKNFVLRVDLRV